MSDELWTGTRLPAGLSRGQGVVGQLGRTIRSMATIALRRQATARATAEAATIARLRAEIDAQAALVRQQAETLARNRSIFERAQAAARIGIWECELPDDRLYWSEGTYDLFDLPRGAPLDRAAIVPCYTPESGAEMQALRARAIAELSGFELDAEIVTPKGNHRWIRLTATVESREGVALRIFGIKQDITEEKLLWERTRYLAEFDVMTGLPNRSQFQARLCSTHGATPGVLLLVDLDGFKEVNDTYGHAAGDECLKETAARLSAVCGDAELVARIGGDEFAVLLDGGLACEEIVSVAAAIVDALGRPVRRGGALYRLGASVGIARIEGSAAQAFKMADTALYAAKAAGRGTFRIFAPEARPA